MECQNKIGNSDKINFSKNQFGISSEFEDLNNNFTEYKYNEFNELVYIDYHLDINAKNKLCLV